MNVDVILRLPERLNTVRNKSFIAMTEPNIALFLWKAYLI